jgi:hypothetical protein
MLRDQNVQAVFFLTGMVLAAVAIVIHGWRRVRPHRSELALWFGLAAVYTMLVFRLGAPERSHLIEYSVLAIFIHRALLERWGDERAWRTAGVAFALTGAVALLDEGIQFFLPHRVFDPVDLFFDGMVAAMALLASRVLNWGRRHFRK